ncbi:MFS transporter [Salinispora arenicola]|uniref:MFS transporter n=1 Tax=Salinispora arenicola TaxID=168697 RepID=UPI00036FC968|nr:MFS transporter [Salinispora arenicola]
MYSRPGRSSPSRRAALVGLCTAATLVWLAFSNLGVALPTIATELSVNLTDMQRANNALSIACGTLLLAGGRLTDLYGHRRMLLLGLLIFGVATSATAFTPNLAGLVAGRAMMGVGSALILPASLAMIPALFDRARQPSAFAAWAATTWAGQAVGPAIGGGLTTLLGWRSLFWLTAPVVLVVYVITSRYAPKASRRRGRVDLVGLATGAGAALCLLFALTESQQVGFNDPLIIVLFAATPVLGAAFVFIETKAADPLVDLRLFRTRSFTAALIVNLAMSMSFAGTLFVLSLYLQDVRGYTAFVAGLLLIPAAGTILGFNTVGARLVTRHNARSPSLWGLVLVGLGGFAISALLPSLSVLAVILGLLIIGAGLGLLSVPVADTDVGGPPASLAGAASGAYRSSSMLGGALGVVLLTTATTRFGRAEAAPVSTAAGLTEAESNQVVNALTNSQTASAILDKLPANERSLVVGVYNQAFTDGVSTALILGGVIAVAGTVLAGWIWPRTHRARHTANPGP